MPAPLDAILAELAQLLEPEAFEDYCPNGLQVAPAAAPADHRVAKLATGVSAQAELFEQAAAQQADLLIVHHGLFWGSGFTTVDATLRKRLKLLIDADVALAAYHLPLDAHPRLGNNAKLAEGLSAERLTPFGRHGERTIGFLADLPGDGLALPELLARVDALTDREPLLLGPAAGAGPQLVKQLAIVSGGGSSYLEEAAAAGAQALLTGEAKEAAMAPARELGVHLIAAGHYATETFGVRALGEHIAGMFDVEHVFIDIPNPV